MARILETDTIKSSNQAIAKDTNEKKNNHLISVREISSNNPYVMALLLGALTTLSEDVAIMIDQDPDYLMTKALLASSLSINSKSLSQAISDQEKQFPWLVDTLTNNLGVSE